MLDTALGRMFLVAFYSPSQTPVKLATRPESGPETR